MTKLNQHYCKNVYEARQIEQKYIDIFKPTLNSVRAYSKLYMNIELDRQLDIELYNILNIYDDNLLGCFVIDYIAEIQNFTECNFCNNKFQNKIKTT